MSVEDFSAACPAKSRSGTRRPDRTAIVGDFDVACPTKRRGRPLGPRPETIEFRLALRPIVQIYQPCTVRQVFYLAVKENLVVKDETGYDKVQRNLLAMRRDREAPYRIPYPWIVDLQRQPYGLDCWGGPEEFIADVSSLYRRDYWRRNDVRVEFWCEKKTLMASMRPIIIDKWGLTFYAGGGFTSDSALYVAGTEIAARKKPTFVYVLSDFDPSGEIIAKAIEHGTKKCPGGISRFTKGVPVHVQQLALNGDQVTQWNLPTRPVGKDSTQAKKFIEKHGDLAVELDAIPPDTLRQLFDEAISRHADYRVLQQLKEVEKSERDLLKNWMTLGREVDTETAGPATVPSLTNQLIESLNSYIRRHDDATWDQVRASLAKVGEEVEAVAQRQIPDDEESN